MINLILFFIGITVVVVTLYFIFKEGIKAEGLFKELTKKHTEIEEYIHHIEDVVDNLGEFVENKNEMLSTHREEKVNPNSEINNRSKEEEIMKEQKMQQIQESINNDDIDELQEIKRLSKMGYSEKELAKKFERGHREISIILKMKDDRFV